MTNFDAAACAAILDLGKTRAKLSVVNGSGTVLATQDAPATEFGQSASNGTFDIEHIAHWCESALAVLYRQFPFAHLIAVTHGATAVAIDRSGAPTPVRDYEADIPFELCRHYDKLRPAFAETGSPPLPLGLNLGRQLFQQQQTPEAFRDTRALLTYPQFWTWRWAGALGTDISSLGCHTDLWEPRNARWSSLAKQFGWDDLFPPLVEAGGVAGLLQNSIATRLQPTRPITVHWGVHDSNAALAAFLGDQEPFTLLSTGTWLIAFAVGSNTIALDPNRDTLWNVDVFGRPVASARFMAGREREAIAGNRENATVAALRALLDTDAIALPSFAAGGGFPELRGRIHSSLPLQDNARAALASLYLALMIDAALDLIGSVGRIIVEGPLADDDAALTALAALRPQQAVMVTQTNCVAHGAARLVFGTDLPSPDTRPIALQSDLVMPLDQRRAEWRRLINGMQTHLQRDVENDES
ncbi:MAG TPA: hypothetical protein VLC91_04540 [Spongiibacteraceae bacterium]|nr:hypothetical protein [Spongiibacteraceae bacterium]